MKRYISSIILSGILCLNCTGPVNEIAYDNPHDPANTSSTYNGSGDPQNPTVSGPVIKLSDFFEDYILTNGSTFYYGNVEYQSSKNITFKIENTGTTSLEISSLTINGDSDFYLTTSSLDYLISAGDWTTFYINFFPGSTSSLSATVTIISNDYYFSTLSFTVTGNGI